MTSEFFIAMPAPTPKPEWTWTIGPDGKWHPEARTRIRRGNGWIELRAIPPHPIEAQCMPAVEAALEVKP